MAPLKVRKAQRLTFSAVFHFRVKADWLALEEEVEAVLIGPAVIVEICERQRLAVTADAESRKFIPLVGAFLKRRRENAALSTMKIASSPFGEKTRSAGVFPAQVEFDLDRFAQRAPFAKIEIAGRVSEGAGASEIDAA